MMSTYLKPVRLNEVVQQGELLQMLDKVPLGRMYQASFRAVVRLHLYFTGRTQELMLEFGKQAEAALLKASGRTQILDSSAGFILQSQLMQLWGDTFNQWRGEFLQAQRAAASIPFGVMAVTHERMVRPAVSNQRSAVSEEIASRHSPLATTLNESVNDGVFSPQIEVLINAASQHLYGDTLNLSGRIWRIDREARDGINAVILKGIANGESAWDMAQELEQFLGANADCPRWTSTRLYGQTKSEIATGTTGLLSGNACDGSGVAYNALRLARTEIQKAHALATDKIMSMQPWVESEQINLSKAHPETDVCDDVVGGGENNDGVYPVGTIELPLHPNCLCFKTAVQMPESEFTSQMQGWLDGTQDWPEMDAYAQAVSGQQSADGLNISLLASAYQLAVWLFGDQAQLGKALS